MPGTSPLEILQEVNPDAVPASQPPEGSNYRPADVQGIACQFCSKFVLTGVDGEDEEAVATGYCGQWEAYVRGDHVSDAYADPNPPLDEKGDEVWEFAEDHALAEVHLADGEATESSEGGFVIKEVLRTGEWPVIPTGAGVLPKPLRIIRDGKSNKDDGVIALAEIVENFKAGAIPAPQVPLSDDNKDHKNITRLNTGFVRDLWIEDSDNGSKLVAKMEFTEPDVREKVLRGTYADVSCGIPWQIRARGKQYGTCLEHVCITNRPFIDGLGPFFAASDERPDDPEITHFGLLEGQGGDDDEAATNLSAQQITELASAALIDQLGLTADYLVTDITTEGIRVQNRIAEMAWSVPFTIDGENLSLTDIANWVEVEGTQEPLPAAENGRTPRSSDDELEQARLRRELMFSAAMTKREKEEAMPLTREELDRLELSDEARAAILPVLDENADLRAQTREGAADQRVAELEELGLKDRPGALKFYRSVMLSDDGGPAVVLLSDNGQEKERLTALQVLDKFIEGVKGSDGKVQLSAQHLASGNDDPPPADTEGEQKPLEERKREAKEALYGPEKK